MSEIKTEESKGIVAINAEQNAKQKQDNADFLHAAIVTAAEDLKLKPSAADIEAARIRFMYHRGNVVPLSTYKTLDDFWNNFKHGSEPAPPTVQELADKREVEKMQQQDLLKHYADTGNMAEYKRLRDAGVTLG